LRFLLLASGRPLEVGILLLEAIYTSFGIDQLLSSREEGMAICTDFNSDITLVSGAGGEVKSAGASYLGVSVSRVYSGSHNSFSTFEIQVYHPNLG
jgi:hypothetical protein